MEHTSSSKISKALVIRRISKWLLFMNKKLKCNKYNGKQ